MSENAEKPSDEKPDKDADKGKGKGKADDKGKASDKGKDKGKSKEKGKGKKGSDQAGPSVAGHPRARRQVRRAKGWGGLVGFGIAAYLSLKAGVPPVEVGLRALAMGAAGYMLAWACAVTVWRHLVLAEMRAAVEGPTRRPTGKAKSPGPTTPTEDAGAPRR
jgi:hypothetical protein